MARRLVAALVGVATFLSAGGVAFAAFRDSSRNTASVRAAALELTDDDASQPAFALSGLKPATAPQSRCVRVRYAGGRSAQVRLYARVTGALADRLRLKVERGSQATPSSTTCNGFTPDSQSYNGGAPGVVFDGRLGGYPTGWATGLQDVPGAAHAWTRDEAHSYRLTVSVADDAAAQGQTSSADFVWEAR